MITLFFPIPEPHIQDWDLISGIQFPESNKVIDGAVILMDDFIITRDRAHAILLGFCEPDGTAALILLKCNSHSGTCNEAADMYTFPIENAGGLTELTDGKVVILGLQGDRCAFFFVITSSKLIFDHATCFEPQAKRKQTFLMDWAHDTYLVWSTVKKNSVLDVFFRNGSTAKLTLYETNDSLECPPSGCRVVSSEFYVTGCYLHFIVDRVGIVRLDLNTFRHNQNDSFAGDAISEIGRMSLDKAGNAYFFTKGSFCNTRDSETVCI